MEDKIEDLIEESNICIRDAYRRGYEDGGVVNRAAISSKKDMLISFESYASKHYRRAIIHDSLFFVNESKSVALTLEELIKNFLLTYDDEEN